MEEADVCYDIFEQEAEFQQMIALLELGMQEIEVEVGNSLEEVEGRRQFPCDFCNKVCKSKGCLTRQHRSKHAAEQGQSSHVVPGPVQIISAEKVRALISDIGRHLTDEKLYNKEDIVELLKLQLSDSFVMFLNSSLLKFKRRKIITSFWNNFMAKQMLTGKNTSTGVKPRRLYFLCLFIFQNV